MWCRLLISIFLFSLISCKNEPQEQPGPNFYELAVPLGFPEPSIPEDNLLTKERIELGKKLFYETALSIDSSLSCGSCHLAAAGFADHNAVSIGVQGRVGFRNSPTLTNVAYHPYFFKEGGSPTLELQVLGPIENHDEMGFNAAELAKRLKDHPEYDELAEKAYDRKMDLFVLTRAIAAFERTLISGNSKYDQFVFQQKKEAMTIDEQAGMELFFSERLACTTCHEGFDFTNYALENNGLYTDYQDKGRNRVTSDAADIGKFKVPTLRNIALTYPYMHDGSLKTLEEVIAHYQAGGKGHPNQHPAIQPFELSSSEKQQLLAFLNSLTDESFVHDPDFLP